MNNNFKLFKKELGEEAKWYEEFTQTLYDISSAETDEVFEELYPFLLREEYRNDLYAYASENFTIEFRLNAKFVKGDETFKTSVELGNYSGRNFCNAKNIWEIFQEVQDKADFILSSKIKL
jgi:hypothetical protein